jgi:hypothetical protein
MEVLMFLNDTIIQWTIIVSVIILFLVTVILNKRTKAPKGTVVPEKCQFCPSSSCVIRVSDVENIKSELKDYLNNCEEENGKS